VLARKLTRGMTKEAVIQMVRLRYKQFRDQVIDTSIGSAEIQVDILPDNQMTTPNQVCAYFPELNKLRMVFSETEIDNDYAMEGSKAFGIDPTWKTYLKHEIIHEYQYKCVKSASEDGKKLMKQSNRHFPGNGHDETFYTAICECAAKLGWRSEKLLELM
jgi:hypothetical protein